MARTPSTTLSLKIAEKLRSLILSGELGPGTRLRQMELADRFDVSPTPVREAFRTLAEEGLVIHDAQRGVVVFTPTVEDVLENYEIRLALEPLAAEIAARRIRDDELEKLDDIVTRMRETESSRIYQGLNRELHALIYAAARMPRLSEMIDSLRNVFEAYVRLDFSARPDPAYGDQVRRQHEEIAQSLRERAPRRARKLMREHLEANRQHIADSVKVVSEGESDASGNGASENGAAARNGSAKAAGGTARKRKKRAAPPRSGIKS